jgi:uncharacterized protein (TIGR02594 family)
MPNTYRVTASSLHIRKEPTTDSESIGFLREGELVEVTGSSEDRNWYHIRATNGHEGWSSYKWLVAAGSVPESGQGFPWMPIARGELGVKERPGSGNNPRVVEYLNSTDLDSDSASSDETPWCSAFVNWCVERSGNEGTNSAWARSWLDWGRRTEEPVPGCIVVFSRGANSGHVAFYVSRDGDSIRVLGGNQSDQVCEASYPKSRLLGYRLPG